MLVVVLGLVLCQDARAFYNPSTGRWLSRDPVGELGFSLGEIREQPFVVSTTENSTERINRLLSEPDGPNICAFVLNNPVAMFDRYGLYTIDNSAWFPEGSVLRVKKAIDSACGARFKSLVTAAPTAKLYCCLAQMCAKGGNVVLSTEKPVVIIQGEERKLLGRGCSSGFGSSIDLYLLNGNKNTDWGAIAIHEFAHCCNWNHGMPGLASWISDSTL